ncbi:MAG: hypothetical protein QXQ73_06335, partial [Desulfurococcaceae archaeon]
MIRGRAPSDIYSLNDEHSPKENYALKEPEHTLISVSTIMFERGKPRRVLATLILLVLTVPLIS